MTDIRILLSFRAHPKVKKLRFKLGDAGPLGFIYLMMFVAEAKPDGVLDGMDVDDIALAADYRGDAAEFVATLKEVKLLDLDGETYSIHDWEEHNPWAAGAEKRREHARKAARAKWKKEKGLTLDAPTKKQQLTVKNNAPGINGHCIEHDGAMQGAEMGNAPIPTPIPSPPPTPNSDQTLSTNPNAVEVTSRARAAAEGLNYSDWHPDAPTIDRIRMSNPDITPDFLERERLEFITLAEDKSLRPDLMRTRFISQVNRHWIQAQKRETNSGPLRTAPPADLQRVPTEQLDAWSRNHGGPASQPGESPDEFRARIAQHLKKRETDEHSSILRSVAAGLTIN